MADRLLDDLQVVCKLSVCIVTQSAMVDKVIAVETKQHPLLCHIYLFVTLLMLRDVG